MYTWSATLLSIIEGNNLTCDDIGERESEKEMKIRANHEMGDEEGSVFSRVVYQIFYVKRGKTQDESKGKREYVGQQEAAFRQVAATQHPVWITPNKRVSFRSCRRNG